MPEIEPSIKIMMHHLPRRFGWNKSLITSNCRTKALVDQGASTKKGTPKQCWGALSMLEGGSTGTIARLAHFRRGRKIDPSTIVKHVKKLNTLMALNVRVSV